MVGFICGRSDGCKDGCIWGRLLGWFEGLLLGNWVGPADRTNMLLQPPESESAPATPI